MANPMAVVNIIFAKTRWSYDSYTDYWRLVELAGFETCWLDEIDLGAPKVYVVTPINGEFRPVIESQRHKVKTATVICHNLERPEGMPPNESPPGTFKKLLDDGYLDAIWVSDRHFAGIMADPRVRFVPFGSHCHLAGPCDCRIDRAMDSLISSMGHRKPYDLIHLSYVWGRREALLKQLEARGLIIAPNGWGKERHERLQQSRLMLNIHQNEAPILEPLRFALAAAYHLPVISEVCADPFPMVRGEHYLEAPFEVLAFVVDQTLRGGELGERLLREVGEALHSLLCHDYPFRDCVLKAVSEL